jgi:hypothetical protein|eukprot:12987-Heterococcus_DN1.PRE.1
MSFGASTIGVAAAAVGDAGVGVAIAMAIGGGLGGCLSSSAFTSLEITTTASTMQATGIAAIPARAKGKMQHKLQQPNRSATNQCSSKQQHMSLWCISLGTAK